MEHVKVLLKDRKRIEDPNIIAEKPVEKRVLPEIPPRSEDILLRKRNILSDDQFKKKQNILLREDIITKQVERLASLQQRVANLNEQKSEAIIKLPVIKPRHQVHQSVDYIP